MSLASRVRETTTVTGSGDATLLGAVSGYTGFAASYGSGVWAPYLIQSSDGLQYEEGIAPMSGSTVLQRSLGRVFSSSAAGARVDFKAGTKTVDALVQDHLVATRLAVEKTAASGGGGGVGGGDASAANQSTQITLAGTANTRLSEIDAAIDAIGAKIPAAPSTAALQSEISGKLPATLGIQTAANSLSIAPASDAVFTSLGVADNPSASFTRPADTTAYAIGDLVANSTTAGSCVSMSLTVARVAAGSFMLRRLKLHKSGTGTTGASFRIHLFRATVTFANGDNAAFSVSGVADYLGAWDVTCDRAFTDGAAGFGIPVIGPDMTVKLASGQTIRAVVEARGAYTPANAEVFTITLDDIQN
jgi:hypothetical protein